MTISTDTFMAVAKDRDRWKQQALWLKSYAEELQASLIEKQELLDQAREQVEVLS